MNMQSEFSNEYETTKLPQHAGKLNGFGGTNYRASFTSFPNNNRPPHPSSFRDPQQFYQQSNDIFPAQATSPMGSFGSHGSFDFGNPQQGGMPGHKLFMEDYNSNAASLLSHHNNPKANGPMAQQQGHAKFPNGPPYSGGVQLTSQTPYGPHLPLGAGANNANAAPPPSTANAANSQGNNNQEEISTIFVVGFPEDMQEREFQNMFTFSPGFEAATLKIPNKEYTAYGARGYQGYSGPNDPYNLVTMNQGGVVVDGGRDGMLSSWPAAPGDDANGPFIANGNLPPRKQIIGFAKFKSRDAAIEARDILQGRRVDIEKGAVLKAEMAKKNLHTKRGVGPVAGPALPSATPGGSQSMQNVGHGNGMSAASHMGDPYNMPSDTYNRTEPIDLARPGAWRDQLQRDVHAVTNGISTGYSSEFHPRKEREEDDTRRRDRESSIYSAMGIPNAIGHGPPTRGPRERAEEEERRRKEKERLRMSNANAFDAFHSVPSLNASLSSAPPLSRTNSGLNGVSLMPPLESGSGLGSSPMLAFTNAPNINQQSAFSSQQHDDIAVGPWDNVHGGGISVSRSSSQRSTSPEEDIHETRFTSGDDHALDRSTHRRPQSETNSTGPGVIGGPGSLSEDENDIDLSKVMSDLVLNTDNGTTSPQLPSPASGASSTSTRNAVDQNPPINTLYVGNLPTSPPPLGYAQDHLEESIRQLFSSQPGYRRMAFRQKSNGPMCFVEFEDVQTASKALNELYGNTLGGLVKHGGIRLSYSKNPLGGGSPTSATSPTTLSQQQQAVQSMAFHQEQQFHSDDTSQTTPTGGPLRRDVGNPSGYGNTFLTSPPPRFTSPANHLAQSSLANTSNHFPLRANGGSLGSLYSYSMSASAGLGVNSSTSSSFAPFGISGPQTIPEQSSSDEFSSMHSQHFHRTLSPPVNSVEATRAG